MGQKLGFDSSVGHFHSEKLLVAVELILLSVALFQVKPMPESIYVATALVLLAILIRLWVVAHKQDQKRGESFFISGPYRLVQFPFFLSSVIMCLAIALYAASFWIVIAASILLVSIFRWRSKDQSFESQSLLSFEYHAAAPKFLPSLLPAKNALNGQKNEKRIAFFRGARLDSPIILVSLCILQWPSFGIVGSEFEAKLLGFGVSLLLIIRIIWIFGNQIGESFSGFRSRFRYRP
jgi:hypothetical protein